MALNKFSLVSLLLIFVSSSSFQVACTKNQSQFFSLMKSSLSGDALSRWNFSKKTSYCNFTGVSCNDGGFVEKIEMSGWSVSGIFPADICSYLPELRVLDLSFNDNLHGDFIYSITNCSLLEEVELNSMNLRAKLPDFSNMKSLRVLSMSDNNITGEFPVSITNLTNLEQLDFSMNFLTGQIPAELGKLKNLQLLKLNNNHHLSGHIPEELGNLTKLTNLDMSVNSLTGRIPESMCRLPKLQALLLYNNRLTGEIPSTIADSTNLITLIIFGNFLTGQVPQNLGRLSPMVRLDLSENRLSGPLPAEACREGKLMYFLVLENRFSGHIPDSYADCKTLHRFRVSQNHLEGTIPKGLLGLPRAAIIDLSYNNLIGPLPDSIKSAANLSQLLIKNNSISGVIPPEISQAVNLLMIDLRNNLLSGPIPTEISNLKKLNYLLLQGNRLNSSIPDSLSLLQSVNVLDLSDNLLTGNIPESICNLLPNTINLANNKLSGPIPPSLIKEELPESFSGNPGLCASVDFKNFPICSKSYKNKKQNYIWAVGPAAVTIIVVGAFLFLKQRRNKTRAEEDNDDMLSSHELKNIYKISSNNQEILKSLDDGNIIGQGGSGTVYKAKLSSGEFVAVKRLRGLDTEDLAAGDGLFQVKELKTEVEILGSISHRNIVKLYGFFSSFDCSLLVYEYLPNGNLGEALHDDGLIHLDWPTRRQIAFGMAQSLAYLHHDLPQPIIHRDIKPTNILLDVDYQPKIADFGIAKILQSNGGKDSTTTAVSGTFGYMAPEYSFSNKATTKGDVYSFGVVLMELITGKKPVEAEFGDYQNIVDWVSTKVDAPEEAMEVIDKRISQSFRFEVIQALHIAISCTNNNPTQRPTMNEVVPLLLKDCRPLRI